MYIKGVRLLTIKESQLQTNLHVFVVSNSKKNTVKALGYHQQFTHDNSQKYEETLDDESCIENDTSLDDEKSSNEDVENFHLKVYLLMQIQQTMGIRLP